MKTCGQIMASQSESQFLAGSRVNPNQCSTMRHDASNRTSTIYHNYNNTPTNNLAGSMFDKSAPKINFSYSQKRQDICTPKQSGFMRDYTSDRNLSLLSKLPS